MALLPEDKSRERFETDKNWEAALRMEDIEDVRLREKVVEMMGRSESMWP